MKTFLTSLVLVICFTAFTPQIHAQKIGHLDVDSLMKIWPAYQKVVDTLADYNIKAQKTANELLALIYKQQRLIDSMKPYDTPLIAALRQSQLEQMKSNYEQFVEIATQEVQIMQAALSDTLYKQLHAAIERVAKTGGYTYILDSSKGGQVMYGSPAYDVFHLVREELKIPLPKKTQ